MRIYRIIRDSKYPATQGLSIDEALLLSVGKGLVPDTIRFYYFSPPSVVIGLNQDINDINLEYIQKKNMSFGRRLTGGGAIIIGCPEYSSQMGVSFLFKLNSDIPSKLSHKFKFFSEIIMQALMNLGLEPEYNRNSDITIKGKKIVGNGIIITENSLLFHSVILFDYDYDLMLKVLNLKNNKSDKEMIEIMKNKITTLNLEKNQKISTTIVEDAIINAIKSIWKGEIVEKRLAKWEKMTANRLFQEKYNTDNWNFQSLDNKGLMGACFIPTDSKEE
ncbi:MAG: biotin/lipoate A/B protein ligase family protein [Promethearchaeota archaeon]